LFSNSIDEKVLREAMSASVEEVISRGRSWLGKKGYPTTIGTVVHGTFGGGLTQGQSSEDIPRNLDEKGGGFAHNPDRLQNVGAIVISMPNGSHARRDQILFRAEDWRWLSQQNNNIPVIVRTPYDRATVLFEGNSDPVDLIW
jgi:hypothetical protein